MPLSSSDTLLGAAVLLLDARGEPMSRTCLNKALFYLDLVSLRDSGQTVTGHHYVARQRGPVVQDYAHTLLAGLQAKGWATANKNEPVVRTGAPLPAPLAELTERALAERVSNWVCAHKNISDFSHENEGWLMAWNKHKPGGEFHVINMHAAMLQVLESDPWAEEADPGRPYKLADTLPWV